MSVTSILLCSIVFFFYYVLLMLIVRKTGEGPTKITLWIRRHIERMCVVYKRDMLKGVQKIAFEHATVCFYYNLIMSFIIGFVTSIAIVNALINISIEDERVISTNS